MNLDKTDLEVLLSASDNSTDSKPAGHLELLNFTPEQIAKMWSALTTEIVLRHNDPVEFLRVSSLAYMQVFLKDNFMDRLANGQDPELRDDVVVARAQRANQLTLFNDMKGIEHATDDDFARLLQEPPTN